MNDHDVCPVCGAVVDSEQWCRVCGVDLRGDATAELRDLASRLAETDLELNTLAARREALANELGRRRWESDRRPALTPTPAAPAFRSFDRPPSHRNTPEWGVERVRNFLLWTGAALLALSALAFTAVAWTHLGPVGRATLLLAFTVVSAVTASSLRTRLPATSGAFTGLTIALALVDWQIVRRAGVGPGISTASWWAIGGIVVAGLSAALSRVAAPVPARRAIALLLPASAVLAVAANSGASWRVALELALIAAAIVAVARVVVARTEDQVVGTLLRLAAGAIWFVGALFALDAATDLVSFRQTILPAVAMLAFALAPGLASRPLRNSPDTTDRAPMAFLVLAAVIGAGLTLVSTTVGSVGMATIATVFGGICIVASDRLTSVWKRAAMAAGVASGIAGFAYAAVAASIAALGPLAWLGHAWTGDTSVRALQVVGGPQTGDVTGVGWSAVGILVVMAVVVALTSRWRDGARRALEATARQAIAVGLVLLAIDVAPVAADASALAACVVTAGAVALVLLGAALVARRNDRALAGGLLVLVPAIPAAGWAALTRTTSVTVIAVVTGAALLAAVISRSTWLRAADAGIAAASAIGLAAVAMLAAGRDQPSAGFAALIVAGVMSLVGTRARRQKIDGVVVEVVGAAGMIGGLLLGMTSAVWVAAGLTAMVPFLLAASLRRDRAYTYGAAAGAAALGAIWAWLLAADVSVVEAYTLPAAAFALAAGVVAWKSGRARSWLNLGPACALALGPTLVLAVARNDDGRAIAVGVAGLVVLLAGAWQQLQAPIVLGAVTLVVLGIEKIGPQAVRLPRWTMLAIAGALLLWVGTTFERRRDDVQRAAQRFAGLG